MADSVPLASFLDRATHLLKHVSEMAEGIRANEYSPGEESQQRVDLAWSTLLPAFFQAAESCPPDPNPITDWIRGVGEVCTWFNDVIRQYGLPEVLFRFNCDGFIRACEEGWKLFREMSAECDPFVVIGAPAIDNNASCFDALVRQVVYWRNAILPFHLAAAYERGDLQRRTASPFQKCLLWLEARGLQQLSARLQTAYDAVIQSVDHAEQHARDFEPLTATEMNSILSDSMKGDLLTKTGEFIDLLENVKQTTADLANQASPSGGLSAREAYHRRIEANPDLGRGWNRASARLRAFANAMQVLEESPEYQAAKEIERQQWQKFAEAIQASIQWAGDELAARHFNRPESIEDWEHLARIIEIPLESIRSGNLTTHEVFQCARAWADRQIVKAKLAGQINAGSQEGGLVEPVAETSTLAKHKRSSERGEGRLKLIAALTKHHKYADGGCLNLEPIGNNELSRLAGVAKRTASDFFGKEFEGHARYRAMCNDPQRLMAAIKALNGEFHPHDFYAARSPNEVEQEDE